MVGQGMGERVRVGKLCQVNFGGRGMGTGDVRQGPREERLRRRGDDGAGGGDGGGRGGRGVVVEGGQGWGVAGGVDAVGGPGVGGWALRGGAGLLGLVVVFVLLVELGEGGGAQLGLGPAPLEVAHDGVAHVRPGKVVVW